MLFRDTPLVTVFCGPVAEEVQIFCFSESQAESFDEVGWRNLVFCLPFKAPVPGTVQIKGEQSPLNLCVCVCVCVCVLIYVHFLLCPIWLVLFSINMSSVIWPYEVANCVSLAGKKNNTKKWEERQKNKQWKKIPLEENGHQHSCHLYYPLQPFMIQTPSAEIRNRPARALKNCSILKPFTERVV